MLQPRNIVAPSVLDIARVNTIMSDLRLLGYLAGESFEGGYAPSHLIGVDCDFVKLYQHPLIALVSQYSSHYEVTTNQTWMVRLEHDLALLEKSTDIVGQYRQLLKALSEMKVIPVAKRNPMHATFSVMFELAKSGNADQVLAEYIKIQLSKADESGQNVEQARSELNRQLEKVEKLAKAVFKFIEPDKEVGQIQAEMKEAFPDLSVKRDASADDLKKVGACTAKLILEIENRILFKLSQHKSPHDQYEKVLLPFLQQLIASNETDHNALRFCYEYIFNYAKTLDPHVDGKRIIEIQTILTCLRYDAQLRSFKNSSFPNTMLAALQACIAKHDVTPQAVQQELQAAAYELGFGQFRSDINRGTALNYDKIGDEDLERECFDLQFKIDNVSALLTDLKAYVRRLGANEFIAIGQGLLEIDSLDKQVDIEERIVQAVLPPCGLEPGENFEDSIKRFIARALEAHEQLRTFGIDTEAADQHLRQIATYLPCENKAAALKIGHEILSYYNVHRNQLHSELIHQFDIQHSAKELSRFTHQAFTILLNQPHNLMLRDYLFYASSSLLADCKVDTAHDQKALEEFCVNILAYNFIVNNQPGHERGYYPEVFERVRNLVTSSSQLTIESLVHTIRDCSTISLADRVDPGTYHKTTFQKRLKKVTGDLACQEVSAHLLVEYRYSHRRFHRYIQRELGFKDDVLSSYLPLRAHQGYMKLPFSTVLAYISHLNTQVSVQGVTASHAPTIIYHPGHADTFNLMKSRRPHAYDATATFNYGGYRRLNNPAHIFATELPSVCAHARYTPYVRDGVHELPHQLAGMNIEIQSNDAYVSDQELMDRLLIHSIYSNILLKINNGEYITANDWVIIDEYTRPYVSADKSQILDNKPIPNDVLLILAWRHKNYMVQIMNDPKLLRQLFFANPDRELIKTMKADTWLEITPNYGESLQLIPSLSASDPAAQLAEPLLKQLPTPNLNNLLGILLLRYSGRQDEKEAGVLRNLIPLMQEYSAKKFTRLVGAIVNAEEAPTKVEQEFLKALACYLPPTEKLQIIKQGGQKLIDRDPDFVARLALSDEEVIKYIIYYNAIPQGFSLLPLVLRYPHLWDSYFNRNMSYVSTRVASHRLSGDELLELIRTAHAQDTAEQEMGAVDPTGVKSLPPLLSLFSDKHCMTELGKTLDQLSDREFVAFYRQLPATLRVQSRFDQTLLHQYGEASGRAELMTLCDLELLDDTAYQIGGAALTLAKKQDAELDKLVLSILTDKVENLSEQDNHQLFFMGLPTRYLYGLLENPRILKRAAAFLVDADFNPDAHTSDSMKVELELLSKDATSIQTEAKVKCKEFVGHYLMSHERYDDATLLQCYTMMPTVFFEKSAALRGPFIRKLSQYPALFEQLALDTYLKLGKSKLNDLHVNFLINRLVHPQVPTTEASHGELMQLWQTNAEFKEFLCGCMSPAQMLAVSMRTGENLLSEKAMAALSPRQRRLLQFVLKNNIENIEDNVLVRLIVDARAGNYYDLIETISAFHSVRRDPVLVEALWQIYLTEQQRSPLECLRALHEMAVIDPKAYVDHPLRLLLINNPTFVTSLKIDELTEGKESLNVEYASVLANFLHDEYAHKTTDNLLKDTCCQEQVFQRMLFWLTSVSQGKPHLEELGKLMEIPQYRNQILDMFIRYPNMQIQNMDSEHPLELGRAFADAQVDDQIKQRLACHATVMLQQESFASAAAHYVAKQPSIFRLTDLQTMMAAIHPHEFSSLMANEEFVKTVCQVPSDPQLEFQVLQRLLSNKELVRSLSEISFNRVLNVTRDMHAGDPKQVSELILLVTQQMHVQTAKQANKRYEEVLDCLLAIRTNLANDLCLPHNHLNALQVLQMQTPQQAKTLQHLQEMIVAHKDIDTILQYANSQDLIRLTLNANFPMKLMVRLMSDPKNATLLLNADNQELLQELFVSPRFCELMQSSAGENLAKAILDPKVLLLHEVSDAQLMAMTMAFAKLDIIARRNLPYINELTQRYADHFVASARPIGLCYPQRLGKMLPDHNLSAVELIEQINIINHTLSAKSPGSRLTPADAHYHQQIDDRLQELLADYHRFTRQDLATVVKHGLPLIHQLNQLRDVVTKLPLKSPLHATLPKLYQSLVTTFFDPALLKHADSFGPSIEGLCGIPEVKPLVCNHLAKLYLEQGHASKVSATKLNILKATTLCRLLLDTDSPHLLASILESEHFKIALQKDQSAIRSHLLLAASKNYAMFQPYAEMLAEVIHMDKKICPRELLAQPEIADTVKRLEEEEAAQLRAEANQDYDIFGQDEDSSQKPGYNG